MQARPWREHCGLSRTPAQGNGKLEAEANEFAVYLKSVIEVLQPSNTLKGEIEGRYQNLLEAIQATKNPLSSVAPGEATAILPNVRAEF